MLKAASEEICSYVCRFGKIPPQICTFMPADVTTKEQAKVVEYGILAVWDHAVFCDDPIVEHQAKLWSLDLQKKVIEFGWEGRHTPDLVNMLRSICGDLPVTPEIRLKARQALHAIPPAVPASAVAA